MESFLSHQDMALAQYRVHLSRGSLVQHGADDAPGGAEDKGSVEKENLVQALGVVLD